MENYVFSPSFSRPWPHTERDDLPVGRQSKKRLDDKPFF
jgi:hypothetical protein